MKNITEQKADFKEWHGYEAPPALVAAWERKNWTCYVNPITGKATVSIDDECRPIRGNPALFSPEDGRLIAAAPDLLAALQSIATTAGLCAITFPNAPGNGDLQAIVRDARAAIAKATNN